MIATSMHPPLPRWAVAIALIGFAACAGPAARPSADAFERGTISVGGRARTFLYAAPSTAAGLRPLVIGLHGRLSDGAGQEKLTHIAQLARSEGFLLALPDGYRRSFDFWYQQAQLLQPHAYEVRYESFVSDFEMQARALSEFLMLPWNEAMLAPGENARAKGYISTPSYEQVVQPINTRAVGRWRPYAKHFAAVLPLLQPYLARWGYEA